MFELLLLGVAATAALAITMGKLTKYLLSISYTLVGSPVLVDVAASSYFLTVFAATGTISGLTIGVFSILMVSIALRLWTKFYGPTAMVVNGSTNSLEVFAHLTTGSIYWVRQLVKSFITGKPVIPPSTIHITWIDVPRTALVSA